MADNVAVIICAAGKSTRFGGKRKKQFVDVAGRAAFIRSIEFFTERPDVKQILLAISPEDEELVEVKWGANLKFFAVKTYFGGQERFETVQKGLELIKEGIELVAIHDAVRCCLIKKWIDDCVEAAAKTGAAILAAPIVGTVKQVREGIIERTLDRTCLYEAQTPQIFKTEIIKKAYARLSEFDRTTLSDDSQLVEALGQEVTIIETDSSNIKITCPSDLAIAEAVIKSRPGPKKTGYIGPYEEAQW